MKKAEKKGDGVRVLVGLIIIMAILALSILFALMCYGCAYQQPMRLAVPATPRVVVKEISPDPNKKSGFDPNMAEVSYLLPDLTRGYIKNEAFPLAIKVWWLDEADGRDILLGSEENAPSPANFYFGNVREFNFPPGSHRLVIERWKFIKNYGWRKEGKDEAVKLEIGRIPKGTWFSGVQTGHYNWAVVIGSNRSRVYEAGRAP